MSPGHKLKCHFVIAQRKVDAVGLNMQAWKYPTRSCLIFEFWMTPRARLFVGVGGVGVEVGLLMRELVSPGHELKCHFLITRRKVDGFGLNMQAWKYPTRVCLVFEFWMIPRDILFVGVGGVGVEVGLSGMFYRPLM